MFKYARRAVKQKVSNEAENRERDWVETLKIGACEARELRARKTLTPRFTDFFPDFEEKTDCFAVYSFLPYKTQSASIPIALFPHSVNLQANNFHSTQVLTLQVL